MIFNVKLTIMRMGRKCSSCKQALEASVEAETAEQAVEEAKKISGADPDTHKFQINYVRAVCSSVD